MCESECCVNRGNVPVLRRVKRTPYFSQIVNARSSSNTICNIAAPTALRHFGPFDLPGQHLEAVGRHSVSNIGVMGRQKPFGNIDTVGSPDCFNTSQFAYMLDNAEYAPSQIL